MKAVQIRIYPNKKQEILIHKTFGCVRFVWNQFLGMSIERYQNNKELKAISQYGYNYLLPALKKEYKWLNEVDSTSLQVVSRNLTDAYKRFFSTKKGFPKFKAKRFERLSYQSKSTTCQQMNKNEIKIAKLGIIKTKNHLMMDGKIKEFTIKQTKSGKYFAVLVYEHEKQVLSKTGKSIGLDFGVADLVIGSKDEIRFATKRYDLRFERQLNYWQRRFSRRLLKAKGAIKKNPDLKLADFKNLQKAKIMIAKYHEKIRNSRLNYLHHASKCLIEQYDIICIEDLKTSNLLKNHKLSRAIANQSWREFRLQLEYKSEWYGKQLIAVNPYKTSQICSNCGFDDGKHELDIREWTCPRCRVSHDRDINAAKNIEKLGLEQALVK